MRVRPLHVLLGLCGALAALLTTRRSGDDEGSVVDDGEPVDPLSPHDPATTCTGVESEGAKRFRVWAIGRWGERESPPSPRNILRACGGKPDEHQEGRAWDLMVRDHAHGEQVTADVTARDAEIARRAGIMYMIWNRRMWRSYEHAGLPANSWGPYEGPNPHTDHVHFSLGLAGSRAETSLYRSAA